MGVKANFESVLPGVIDLRRGIVSDGDASGIIDRVTIGATVSAYQPLRAGTSFQYIPANATSIGGMPAVALALEAGTTGDVIRALFFGKVRNDSWNWSVGGIFVNTSSGGLVQGDPDTIFSTTGNIVQRVGFAISADIAFFKFSTRYVSIA